VRSREFESTGIVGAGSLSVQAEGVAGGATTAGPKMESVSHARVTRRFESGWSWSRRRRIECWVPDPFLNQVSQYTREVGVIVWDGDAVKVEFRLLSDLFQLDVELRKRLRLFVHK
jgi:hypothetical protein